MNSITKHITLNAPQSKVWTAITDYKKFGTWFRVYLETPFVEGQHAHGHITSPGYEHYKWKVLIKKITPQSYFAFEWHPYAVDTDRDYEQEKPTLVEFRLESMGPETDDDATVIHDTTLGEKTRAGLQTKTKLTIIESGFDHVPEDRRTLALKMNEGGWEQQAKNIEIYLAGS